MLVLENRGAHCAPTEAVLTAWRPGGLRQACLRNRFPIIAGRVRRRKPAPGEGAEVYEVVCNDAGVGFETFTADASLADFDAWAADAAGGCNEAANARNFKPRSNLRAPTFCPHIYPLPILRGAETLLRVRVTSLRCGGAVLGVAASHITFDGQSLANFMQSWALTHSALPGEAARAQPEFGHPAFDRTIVSRAIAGMALAASAAAATALPSSSTAAEVISHMIAAKHFKAASAAPAARKDSAEIQAPDIGLRRGLRKAGRHAARSPRIIA